MAPRTGATKRQTPTPKRKKPQGNDEGADSKSLGKDTDGKNNMGQTPQKRKAVTPDDTDVKHKKRKVGPPSISWFPSDGLQLNDDLSTDFGESSSFLYSDSGPETPREQIIFKKVTFRDRSSPRPDDLDSFVAYDDSDDGSIHSEFDGNRRRKNKKPLKEEEDEAYVGGSDSESDVEEYSIPKSEKDEFTFDYSIEKARRWSGAVSLPKGIWSEGERDLFSRLAMRGFEPLFSKEWHGEFGTLPASLFTEGETDTKPLIHAIKSNFHATRSLSGLFTLSGRVRDCRILHINPEKVIKKAIQKYVRWAMYDANLHTYPQPLPVHAIYSQKKGESTVQALGKLNRRLEKLARRYSDAVRSPDVTKGAVNLLQASQRTFPILYGFFLCGPIVAMLTMDSDPESKTGWKSGSGSRFVSQFDLAERGQDVWNSLAIAIMTMYIRKTMMKLKEEAEGGHWEFPNNTPVDTDEDL